jgi:hypothetical protein
VSLPLYVLYFVMPGLVPGIPIELAMLCYCYRDGRDKPGLLTLKSLYNSRLHHTRTTQ